VALVIQDQVEDFIQGLAEVRTLVRVVVLIQDPEVERTLAQVEELILVPAGVPILALAAGHTQDLEVAHILVQVVVLILALAALAIVVLVAEILINGIVHPRTVNSLFLAVKNTMPSVVFTTEEYGF
jgi:hypothetical protein